MADDAAPSGSRKDTVGNLDELSVEELTALSEQINAKRRDKVEQARSDLMADFQKRAAALGLKFDGRLIDFPATVPSSGERKKRGTVSGGGGGSVPAKYAGPNGEQWSGRGRTPKWMQAMEAEGRSRDEFKL